MSKKAYMNLLKEAISEFDTSKTSEVKGPFLDSILKWRGDGELPTNKDAGSILERYYYNEDNDEGVDTIDEAKYEDGAGSSAGASMKHGKGAGTDQAGTSDKSSIKASKKDIEKELAKEMEEIEAAAGEELSEADDADADADADADDEGDDETVKEELEMENAIIEKLIAEMEADDDAQGAGTQQAGTGDADKLVPDRKDDADDAVKPKKYNAENAMIEAALQELEEEIELSEQDDDADEEDEEEKEEKDLDVDKNVKEDFGVPGGPSPHKKGEDWESDEAAYSEAFELFKEAIQDDE